MDLLISPGSWIWAPRSSLLMRELQPLILSLLGSGGWIASGSPQSAPFIPGFWVAAYESLTDGDITWLCFAYRQWFHLNKGRFWLCLLHCRVSSPTSPTMQQLCEEKSTGQNNFFFLSIILKMSHDWQVGARRIWSTWISFSGVFYIETADATVTARRVRRAFKG